MHYVIFVSIFNIHTIRFNGILYPETTNSICLVDEILKHKEDRLQIKTQGLYQQINQLIYQLYDLTFGEIEIIENGVK